MAAFYMSALRDRIHKLLAGLPAPGTGERPTVSNAYSLTGILAEICDRAGIPPERIDLSGLEGSVEGFSMNCDYSAHTGIEALARIFLFDTGNWDGMLHFVPRGAGAVAEITDDDLVDDGEDVERSTRLDSISVPRVMHLEYFDLDGGLAPNKQTSDRSLDARSKSEVSTETTVLMTADDAARAVIINHKVAIEEQRGEVQFSLPDSWAALTPTNVVDFRGERLRITEVEIDDGLQKYKAVHDRASNYGTTLQGVQPPPPSEAPSLIIGDTILHIIDTPILRDADDRLGYYVAIQGVGINWGGALVELSTDGGLTYPESVEAYAESITGELTTSLASHSRWYPDRVNTCSVELIDPNDELDPADLAGMMRRQNLALIGNELVNFGEVTETAPGVWELSHFLRGRKGTAITAHTAGERFVLLDRGSLFFIDAEAFQVGQALTFRVTSMGADDPGPTQTVTFVGRSQQEAAPAYLRAVRSGGDIIIRWQGVGRLGGGVNVAMGSWFAGFRVAVNGVTHTTLAETLTVTDPGGAVTITVRQLNSITGPGPTTTVTL